MARGFVVSRQPFSTRVVHYTSNKTWVFSDVFIIVDGNVSLTSSVNSPKTFPSSRRNFPPLSPSTVAGLRVNAWTICTPKDTTLWHPGLQLDGVRKKFIVHQGGRLSTNAHRNVFVFFFFFFPKMDWRFQKLSRSHRTVFRNVFCHTETPKMAWKNGNFFFLTPPHP